MLDNLRNQGGSDEIKLNLASDLVLVGKDSMGRGRGLSNNQQHIK